MAVAEALTSLVDVTDGVACKVGVTVVRAVWLVGTTAGWGLHPDPINAKNNSSQPDRCK